jgi:hypothetical protein
MTNEALIAEAIKFAKNCLTNPKAAGITLEMLPKIQVVDAVGVYFTNDKRDIMLQVVLERESGKLVSARVVSPQTNKGSIDMFSGGNGDSLESAVVIHAADSLSGVTAEYKYVTSKCGERRREWDLHEQKMVGHNGKPHDVFVVKLSNGQFRTFYFDVSNFFGK